MIESRAPVALLEAVKRLPSLLAALITVAAAAAKPNVVVIMTDDQGYGDIAAHGNPVIQTPELDRLHAESVRFTDFHVDPTCSPTRGALLTGKYSHRAKVWHTIAAGNHLRAGEMTMADAFRANGYRTGMFGKWHLGSNFPYRPMDRGFDEWLGQGDGGTGTTDCWFFNDRVDDHHLHNGEWVQKKGWAPDVHFDAAIDFIRAKKDEPFFIYLNTYIPHTPHTIPDEAWAADYLQKVNRREAWFFACIEHVDRCIGRLRKALDDEGLAEDTILIFLTDNGGTGGVKVFNAGMRAKKGSVYDGGHRVPCFIHWPGGGLGHGVDVADLNAHIDVLPTLVELCGLKLPHEVDFDGRSFAPQLREPTRDLPERTLFAELQRTFEPQKWKNAVAMTRRWRLVNNEELYDIKNDPGQQTNVMADHPEVVAKLRADFDQYWKRVTPGDRDRVHFIVGDKRDPETFLHSADWYLSDVPWSHGMVAPGHKAAGTWWIQPADPGIYRFEVRRWPREADAPITGVPEIEKKVDAWTADGPKPDLIYGGTNTKFKALPVAKVRLRIGDHEEVKAVPEDSKSVVFEAKLGRDPVEVEGVFLDKAGEVLAGTYYVYCSKVE